MYVHAGLHNDCRSKMHRDLRKIEKQDIDRQTVKGKEKWEKEDGNYHPGVHESVDIVE